MIFSDEKIIQDPFAKVVAYFSEKQRNSNDNRYINYQTPKNEIIKERNPVVPNYFVSYAFI